MAAFPAHPDAVTAEWLSATLRREVDAVRWEPIGTGQVGDSVRFHLDCADAHCPATLAGKFPAADATSRGTATAFGLYAKEVRFYREIAPKLEVRVPSILAAELSSDGSEFLLLFEDLGPARQGDQISGCTLEDARAAIRQAAAIHGPSWQRNDLTGRDWLCLSPEATAQVRALYGQAQAIFRDRYVDTLESEYMEVCEDLAAHADLWFGRPQDRNCILHGDFRLDNMLFDIRGGREPVAILDWQTVAVGNPLTDVAYFLGCGLGEAMRRRHEDDLLSLYRDAMGEYGVSFEEERFRHNYRLGALQGVSTAVFSAAFVERTARGDENFLSMARGACGLALEHGSIAALKETERC
ncbi:phosphotransferase family protein [Qipengyuania sp. MTN3-11]|uniref:phosphotransferase family protein n=1 Tax=Qipengyuania sp. MTN3-11 TaxID=3056557 RepID=UPI0036F402CF